MRNFAADRMRNFACGVFVFVLVGIAGLPAGAQTNNAQTNNAQTNSAKPQGITVRDAAAIRGVIEAQLGAFAKDDAALAFSYAAPEIQSQFGNAQTFMRMVKTGYPAVYRPASVTFLKPERTEEETWQAVQLSDAEGQVWIATYRMQLQKGQLWRINGCTLEKSAGRVT